MLGPRDLAFSLYSDFHAETNPKLATLVCLLREHVSLSLTLSCEYFLSKPTNTCRIVWNLERLSVRPDAPALMIVSGHGHRLPESEILQELDLLGLNGLEVEIFWSEAREVLHNALLRFQVHHQDVHYHKVARGHVIDSAKKIYADFASQYSMFEYGEWEEVIERGGSVRIDERELSLEEMLESF